MHRTNALLTTLATTTISLGSVALASPARAQDAPQSVIDACSQAAGDQGYQVQSVVSSSSSGIVFPSMAVMRVQNDSDNWLYDVTCRYRFSMAQMTDDPNSMDTDDGSAVTATEAALGLYGAWHEGSYNYALEYATPVVVNQLFAHPNNRYWEFRGCQSNKCTFNTARGTVTMQAQSLLGTQQQNFRVIAINFPSNPPSSISPSPEDAALGLVRAWRANNLSVAQQYASPDVVNEMFGLRSGTNLVFEGCQENACLFSYPNGSVRLQTQRLLGTSTPNYRVTDVIIMNL